MSHDLNILGILLVLFLAFGIPAMELGVRMVFRMRQRRTIGLDKRQSERRDLLLARKQQEVDALASQLQHWATHRHVHRVRQ